MGNVKLLPLIPIVGCFVDDLQEGTGHSGQPVQGRVLHRDVHLLLQLSDLGLGVQPVEVGDVGLVFIEAPLHAVLPARVDAAYLGVVQ